MFGYHGKLQEVMQMLRQADVEVPFVMPERVYDVTKVCEKHGMNLGCFSLSSDKVGRQLLDNNSALCCVLSYEYASACGVA